MNRILGLGVVCLLLFGGGSTGCGGGSGGSPPLGRAIQVSPAPAGRAPAPVGDPLPERAGTLPGQLAGEEERAGTGGVAPTPQDALRRYALAYTNWDAATLPAHLRWLATISIGPARLAALQTAAGLGAGGSELLAHRVRNTGTVLAITPWEGAASGQWVIVTQEHTSGTGAYTGLPALPHVTLARVRRVGGGWVVYEWEPQG